MHQVKKVNWIDPDQLAKNISKDYQGDVWAYLRSPKSKSNQAKKSIIALHPKQELANCDLEQVIQELQDYNQNYTDSYLTLLSYEYSCQSYLPFEKSTTHFINIPDSIFIKFSLIYEFIHDSKEVRAYYDNSDLITSRYKNISDSKLNKKPFEVCDIRSNFSQSSYHDAILDIQNKIRDGICYQTNLTRKFYGKFDQTIDSSDSLDMFLTLSQSSPANYSSYIKYHSKIIISNSPELFIKIENDTIQSEPIKGTAPRNSNPKIDQKNKECLLSSPKEKAENLMIVDLARNDLSPPSIPGSVSVEDLFTVKSYPSYHHLSSVVKSKIAADKTIADVIRSSFPPASMTGAPKVKAISTALSHEKMQRGIYSGCIGMINGKKDAQLSVVIRTLIIDQDRFEFQVGGGITIDSIPEKEIEETYVKAEQICKILGINSLKDVS